MTLQFSLVEKTEISWKCLCTCASVSIRFLLLCGHLTLVLKYPQCRTFEMSFSFAKMLQRAGRSDACVQLSDGFKSLLQKWGVVIVFLFLFLFFGLSTE